ncbi:MAG: CPBP family intramembrane metalloprotease [Chloroflexi bacterium]|nr:CPBP family intramembrane metalloprotease [Chloroflexota bacterium]
METSKRRLSPGALVLLAGLVVAVPATIGAALIAAGAGLLPAGADMALPRAGPPVGLRAALALIGLVVAASLGWLAAVVGLALYVFLPARAYPEAIRTYASYRTVVACLALVNIGSAIVVLPVALALQLTGAASPADPPSPPVLVVATVGSALALLFVAYFRVVRPGVISWRDVGLTRGDLPRRLALGLVAGLAVLVAAGLVEQVLQRLGVRQNQSELFAAVRDASPRQFVALLLAAAVLTPFAEEVFFRGYVFTALLRERGPWQAYIGSAALFSAVHFNLAALAPIFVIGLVMAFVYHRTRTLVPVIVAHGVNNLVALSALYFGVG